jgi:hypothetical protein
MSYVKTCNKTTEHRTHEWFEPSSGPLIVHICHGLPNYVGMPNVVKEPAAVQPVNVESYPMEEAQCLFNLWHAEHYWSQLKYTSKNGHIHRWYAISHCPGVSEQATPDVEEPAAVQPATTYEYVDKKQYEEIVHQRNVLIDALIKTVKYVGLETLPPIAGWSWYDAIFKYAPLEADLLYKEFHALKKVEEPVKTQNAVKDPHADGSVNSTMHQIDLAEIFISRRLSDISANPILVDSVSAQGMQALLIIGDLLAAGWRPSNG